MCVVLTKSWHTYIPNVVIEIELTNSITDSSDQTMQLKRKYIKQT